MGGQEFPRLRPEQFLADLRRGTGFPYLISEFELDVFVARVVIRGRPRASHTVLIRSFSMDAISRIKKGKCRQGVAARMLYFLLQYCDEYEIDIFFFTIRSGRATDPVFI